MNNNNSNNFHIRVAIRTRPLLASDYQRISAANHAQGLATAVHVINENNSILIVDPVTAKPTHQFFFDKVFQPEETTEEVYNIVAKQIVCHAVKGYNGTVFAYGQTSTGKTHTVFGHSHSCPGIVALAIDDLFAQIEAAGKSRMFFVRLAVLEIYNERLTDLAAFDVKQPPKTKSLRIRETPNGFIFVEHLVEEVCTTRESALDFLNECLTRRHMAQTLANRDSSRSHVICRLVVESRPVADSSRQSTSDNILVDYDQAPTTIGELNFVDLAGSECAVKILAPSNNVFTGTLSGGNSLPPETVVRLKEGRAINRSLLMLGIVINQLSESRPIVNYRNSKLTRILQNALGGNSLTAIICTISPTEADKRQTVSTLQFASNAKSIKTKPRLNETFSADQAILRRLQLEIERLRRRIVELEMQQSFSSTQVGSSTNERQQLHENERLLLDMIAGGKPKSRQGLTTTANDNDGFAKQPALSRRMTWAPNGSGHAVLMFTDNKDRPESSRLASDERQVITGDDEAKPIIFHGVLEKVSSNDVISSVDSQVDSRSDSQESSVITPIKAQREPITATIDRIENEVEFRERFVGRQYFDVVARNYERLKNVIEQSLGTPINEEDDFSDVSDRISLLVAKSRQSSQVSSATSTNNRVLPTFSRVGSSLNVENQRQTSDPLVFEGPATSVTVSFGPESNHININNDSDQSSRNFTYKSRAHSAMIPIRIIRRTAMSARLPPLVVHSSLSRTKSSIGSYQFIDNNNSNSNNNNQQADNSPRPVSRSSTVTLTEFGQKRVALQQQLDEDSSNNNNSNQDQQDQDDDQDEIIEGNNNASESLEGDDDDDGNQVTENNNNDDVNHLYQQTNSNELVDYGTGQVINGGG